MALRHTLKEEEVYGLEVYSLGLVASGDVAKRGLGFI